jgi:hypothetical protein
MFDCAALLIDSATMIPTVWGVDDHGLKDSRELFKGLWSPLDLLGSCSLSHRRADRNWVCWSIAGIFLIGHGRLRYGQ